MQNFLVELRDLLTKYNVTIEYDFDMDCGEETNKRLNFSTLNFGDRFWAVQIPVLFGVTAQVIDEVIEHSGFEPLTDPDMPKGLIGAVAHVLATADNTGCSEDITVVSAFAVGDLRAAYQRYLIRYEHI